MPRRNILLLMPLVLTAASCSLLSGQSAEQRMNNSRTAAIEVAADLGIKQEELLSEEEYCDLTGCLQQFYFATDLTNLKLSTKLSSSSRFRWNKHASVFVPPITKPYIDPYAKQIQLVDGKVPATEPVEGATTSDGVAIGDRFFEPWLVLYVTSDVPSAYICKSSPINGNILRVSFQATKLSKSVPVTTGP